jgi:hypothetical protein
MADPHPAERPPADRARALEAVRIADRRWIEALDESEFAPPDPGFSDRVRMIADAAEQEAAALQLAHDAGLGWRPMSDMRTMRISHEMRPGGNRPGQPEHWQRFDRAVERLGVAMAGVAPSAVARAYSELSEIAREIADDLDVAAARARRQAS